MARDPQPRAQDPAARESAEVPPGSGAPEVWIPGSPGRWPFAGHVRGAWSAPAPIGGESPLVVAWAARVAATGGPVEAWSAAEEVRAAFGRLTREPLVGGRAPASGIDPAPATIELSARLWRVLRGLDPAVLAREDLSLLLVTRDNRGLWLTGFGWASVLVFTEAGPTPAALAGSLLLGDPGLPATDGVPQPPHRSGSRFLALPPGVAVPAREVEAACGVHR